MGKIDDNKKRKKDALLSSAFQLFTEKGFSKTTISDIVNHAGLAKGTSTCILRINMTSETGSLPTKPGSYSTMPARNLKKQYK